MTTPISGTVCHPWVGPATIDMRAKFEVYTITCNEDMKGNAKCKNVIFEPPFGGLRDNAQGLSMARRKSNCRLPISDN